MNLKLRILIPVTVLIIVIACAIASFAYLASSSALKTSLYSNMQRQADNMAMNMDNFAAQIERDAVRSAARPEMKAFLLGSKKDAALLDRTNKILKELELTYPDITRIQILTPDGKVAASSNPATINSDFATRAYFSVPFKENKSFRAAAFVSKVTKSSVMVSSAPIVQDGKVLGVLTCTVALTNYYNDYIKPIAISKTGMGYMINSAGEIILHKDFDTFFRSDLPISPLLQKLAKDRTGGVEEYVDEKGVRMIFMHVPMQTDNNTAILQAEYDDVFSSLAAMRSKSIMISLGAILAGIILVMLIVTPITSTLRKGVAFAEQVKQGNLKGRLDIHRSDELGALADALQSIPASLETIVDEYAALEQKVEQGKLSALGDSSKVQGDFASLVQGTNSVLARFHTVLDNIPSPVAILDEQMCVVYMNRFGINATTNDFAGKKVATLFAFDNVTGLQEVQQTKTAVTAESSARYSGSEVSVQYSCIPMPPTATGKQTILLLVADVSDIKRSQQTMEGVANSALDISNRVASAAEELSATVAQVSEGSEQQRSMVSSVAVAMEQMNSAVVDIAHRAGQSNEQSESTKTNAREGANLVSDVAHAVSQVRDLATTLHESMADLGAKAESIGAVMNVISDIADQTNLLALNAAIEAARAGDAGRGFAVVADEVRKLAEKTMTATHEVDASVAGIQNSTKDNLEKVENTIASVEKATELTSRSAAMLEDIVSSIDQNSTFVASIAAATEEQSSTSEEITHSVEDISNIASQSATGMVEAGAAVQELSRLAQELYHMLEVLKQKA